ncbi:MAG: hypothetical protein IKR28_06005, partial [Selenomonadaceae bacterium]|nr:hypothetical protein [Selenomonadaceae bacterium]
MRKELMIVKRILAGVAAGLVLFIYVAIPSLAKQINTEDDPHEIMDVPYTHDDGGVTYDHVAGLYDDFWAEQPFDAYWHNEGGGKKLDSPRMGRNMIWANQDLYYSGYAVGRKALDGAYGYMGQEVILMVRLYTDDEWKMTRLEEKTNGNVVNVVYQINARTGDTIQAYVASPMSGTINAVLREQSNTNKRQLMKNDPEYDPEWTIEPTEYYGFFTNIHPARQEGKWLDDAEKYEWPSNTGDAYFSGLQYTLNPEDDIVYADSLAKVKFDNKYTGVVVDAEINYRYKIVNLDNVNGLVESDTTTAKDTEGEDEGTEISQDIVEGEDYSYEDDSEDSENGPFVPDVFDYPDYGFDDDAVAEGATIGGISVVFAGGAIGASTAGRKKG